MTLAGEPVDVTLLVAGLLDLHSLGALSRCSKGLSRLVNECTEYRLKREAFDAAVSGDFGPAIKGDMLDVLRCVIAHPDGLRNLIPSHPDESRPPPEARMDDVSILLPFYRSFLDNNIVRNRIYVVAVPRFPHLHILFYIDWSGYPSRWFKVVLGQNLQHFGGRADTSENVYLFKESIAPP